MLLEKLNEDELEFCESYYYSPALAECLFSDLDNLTVMDKENFCHIRLGQYPLLSHEYLLDYDSSLNEKANFNLRKSAGEVYALGGRLFGKTLCVEKIDFLESVCLLGAERCGFASYDQIHIRGVLEELVQVLEHHPFFKIFEPQITRNPNYRFYFKTGYLLESINMNVTGKKPGAQFFQKHLTRLYIEEASFETEEVFKQRRDSVSENGCIFRIAGMTNFTKYSPCGKIFYDWDQRGKIVNLPQYCLAEDTQILMEDLSVKPIQDVELGERILSFSENSPFKLEVSTVLSKTFLGEKETLNLNNRLFLTPDHKVLIKRGQWDKYWKKAQDLSNKDLIYISNYCLFGEDYYWGVLLGFLDTEAHFRRNSWEFFQKDEPEAIEWVLNFLNIDCSCYRDTQNPEFFRYYIKVGNFQLIESKRFLLKNSKETQYGYLAGCILSDGNVNLYIDKDKPKVQLSIAQKNKAREIEQVLLDSNIKFSRYFSKYDEMFRFQFPRFELPFYIPYSKKVIKYSKALIGSSLKSFTKKTPNVEISKARKVWDLTTSNHTLIANGIIVHNCNPKWDDNGRKQAIKDFGGEQAVGYRVFIKGEVVEDGISVFDMTRVRPFYDEHRVTKVFEITKKTFADFERLIFLDKPKNAEQVYIAADIGESAPTEIVIIFKIDKHYRYEYNVVLYGLTDKEQYKIFKWLAETLEATFIGIDTTDGTGRAIYRSLEEVFPEQNLAWVAFNEKLPIGFEKDAKGNYIKKDGRYVHKEEFVSEWSIKHLKDVLYAGALDLPMDYKLDKQLNSVISMQSGNRTVYEVVSEDDHLFQAFQVFSIAHWSNEFSLLRPIIKKKFCKSGVAIPN